MDSLFCNLEPFFVGGRPQQNQVFACGLSLFLYGCMFLLSSLLSSLFSIDNLMSADNWLNCVHANDNLFEHLVLILEDYAV